MTVEAGQKGGHVKAYEATYSAPKGEEKKTVPVGASNLQSAAKKAEKQNPFGSAWELTKIELTDKVIL
jgi:hypothetical protein